MTFDERKKLLANIEAYYGVSEMEEIIKNHADVMRGYEEKLRPLQIQAINLKDAVKKTEQQLAVEVQQLIPAGRGNDAQRKAKLQELTYASPVLMRLNTEMFDLDMQMAEVEAEQKKYERTYRSALYRYEMAISRLRFLAGGM